MNISLFLILLFCLQCFYWLIGNLASRTLIKDQADYYLAGRKISTFPLMMTFLATQVGGGVVLGAAEEAYLFGWSVLFYPLGAVLGLLLLGIGFGRRLAACGVSTVAELFETAYQSKLLRRIASLLSVVSLYMILVAQVIASHKFLASLAGINTPLFIIFWAIVVIYTVKGGLKAVVYTDTAQAAVFSFVFVLCFAWAFLFEPSLPSLSLPDLDQWKPASSNIWGWLLMPCLYLLIEQDMAQRCFAGVSSRTVSYAALMAGIAMMGVCFFPIFFGVLANSMGLEIPPQSSVLMTVIEVTTTPWITALAGCALLAAIISSATSLINAIGSNLSHDFGSELRWGIGAARAITGIISISALGFAFCFDNIVELLIQGYELAVSCLLIPVMFVLFGKSGSYLAAWAALLAGLIGFWLFRFYPVPFPKELGTILLSLIGYGSGEVLFRFLKSVVKGIKYAK